MPSNKEQKYSAAAIFTDKINVGVGAGSCGAWWTTESTEGLGRAAGGL